MTVQTDNYGIGASGIASQKFTFTAPNDGTFKLGRGVLGAESSFPLVVNADDSISGNMGIGAGQTWQDVKASRAKLVTYTNSTGRTIVVSIMASGGGASNVIFTLSVSGIVVGGYQTYTATSQGFVSAIVPPGATYILNADVSTINYWAELR